MIIQQTQNFKIVKSKNGIYYELFFGKNNKKIGRFIFDISGTYYYEDDNKSGLWSDYALLEIGTLLKSVNDEFENQDIAT